MRTGTLIRTLTLAMVIAACAVAPAHAEELTKPQVAYLVLKDYRDDGAIKPCAFTVDQLRAALDGITPDVRQYASDYPSAIKAAISARTRASCGGAAPGGGGTGSPGGAPGTPGASGGAAAPPAPAPVAPAAPAAPAGGPTQIVVPEPPSPAVTALESQAPSSKAAVDRAAASSPRSDAPAPLVGLGALAALLALTLSLLLAARRLGLQHGRLAPAYHSWREARWRAGGLWEDFRDWLRVGR